MAAETGEQAEVKEALLAWINVFREEGEHVGSLEELSDGVALFELMVRVAPAHFDVDSIKRNAAGNPFLCASNLGKLGRGPGGGVGDGVGDGADPRVHLLGRLGAHEALEPTEQREAARDGFRLRRLVPVK